MGDPRDNERNSPARSPITAELTDCGSPDCSSQPPPISTTLGMPLGLLLKIPKKLGFSGLARRTSFRLEPLNSPVRSRLSFETGIPPGFSIF